MSMTMALTWTFAGSVICFPEGCFIEFVWAYVDLAMSIDPATRSAKAQMKALTVLMVRTVSRGMGIVRL